MTPSNPQIESLDDCAKEPIRIPGSVQPHGMLFCLNSDGFVVEQVSENAAAYLGVESDMILGKSFLDHVEPESLQNVTALIREAASTYVNPFRVPLLTAEGRVEFDGIAHILSDSITVLELERNPDIAEGGLATEGLDSYLQLIQRSLNRISDLDQMAEITQLMAEEVRRFTGFDRVMVYRFAEDFHGEVIAESVVDEMEPYLGLHYPASDIPAQARELYLKTQVRLLQDVDGAPSPLVPQLHPQTGEPLDMSQAVLRSMSPIHLQYLRNMGVKATLTLSLVVNGRLWGLIACHHRAPRFVSYGVRATASLFAVVMSAQLDVKQRNLESQQVASARRMALKILTGFKDYADLSGSFGDVLPDFVKLFSADGAAIVSRHEVRTYGSVPGEKVLVDSLNRLAGWETEGLYLSHHTAVDFPVMAAELPKAAGVVAINISDGGWLLIFRDEVVQTIRWAGDPERAKTVDDQGRLAPRHSFAAWQETVAKQSLPWSSGVAALTSEIRAGVVELVRKRNLVLERSNHELRRFAGVMAHEVKNQLQAGMMALSLVRDDKDLSLNPNLAQLVDLGVDSLTGLSKFIREMLDFAQTDAVSDMEDIEFSELVTQVVDQLTVGGRVEDTSIEIGPLPKIRGSKTQIFHLMTNLIRNAMVHARVGTKPLEIKVGMEQREGIGPVIVIRDNGRGIAEAEQKKIFDYFYRSQVGETSGSGIGLAFCAQIAERHDHRLWVESEAGRGAAFCFTVTVLP